MIDRTHTGLRCTTRVLLRTVEGILPQGSHGTVVYEMDNVGRHLILVNWDRGFSVPVDCRSAREAEGSVVSPA